MHSAGRMLAYLQLVYLVRNRCANVGKEAQVFRQPYNGESEPLGGALRESIISSAPEHYTLPVCSRHAQPVANSALRPAKNAHGNPVPA